VAAIAIAMAAAKLSQIAFAPEIFAPASFSLDHRQDDAG
jgi:hypothetical protein